MTIETIRAIIISSIQEYPIKNIVLFGSRADGTNREDSDVDLIVEFTKPVSLLTLSQLRLDLEDALGLEVDVIHGPIRDSDMLEINNTVEIYAA